VADRRWGQGSGRHKSGQKKGSGRHKSGQKKGSGRHKSGHKKGSGRHKSGQKEGSGRHEMQAGQWQTLDASRALANMGCKQGSGRHGMQAGQWQTWDTRRAVGNIRKEKGSYSRDEMRAGQRQTKEMHAGPYSREENMALADLRCKQGSGRHGIQEGQW
jgi:hypothetical protein